jgi:FMN phosphatase YigB (HAD superfamily)
LDALQIATDFDEVIIDDIFATDRPGKKEIFSAVAKKYKAEPEQVWIIGDNPDAEINAGHELGMITVLRVNGDETKIAGKPSFTISSFEELNTILTATQKINS